MTMARLSGWPPRAGGDTDIAVTSAPGPTRARLAFVARPRGAVAGSAGGDTKQCTAGSLTAGTMG